MAKTKSAYIGRGKLMFGFIFIFAFLVSLISFSPSIYALTFSRDVTVSFTFDSTIGLTLSSDLYIYNLAPGSSSDSNIITVSILTNNITGYTLNATVGDTTFNNRDLTHIADSTQKFSSINYGSSLASLSTDNTWGYSYSLNNGSTWTNYSGLPLYSDTSNVAVLKTSTGAASSWSGDTVKFKIAAKAATTQPSGVYRNVINFNVVANVVPQYTVQFNANGGSGTMPNQAIFRDTATKLAANQFNAPAGYIFDGWNTAADGSGTAYAAEESVTNIAAAAGTITLYAQWKATLYDIVANMSKGKQTVADIRTAIVTPTSANPISSNSGVYEYDASVFGTASDASNNYQIYYYRGILDTYSNMGTYGSNGLSDAYPNYVRLANNTCWRIVRTTGSGGVKMIYNGIWDNNTCANSNSYASAVTGGEYNTPTPNNGTDDNHTKGFIVYVGYNYNSTYAYNNTNYTSAIANSTLFNNGTSSIVKTGLEDWYADNMMSYTSTLESSAGYCDDRTTYTSNAISSLIASTVPYQISSATIYFGSYIRIYTADSHPSLNCPNTTGYDLLTIGNGLTYPSSLLTVDEVALAGTGTGSYSSSHTNSYLNIGVHFWLLSPHGRESLGRNRVFVVNGYGNINIDKVNQLSRTRPVISLKAGTTAVSGTGIATDPWVVAAP